MNKRIAELIDQATEEVYSETWGRAHEFNKEKFAMLIIKECADRLEERAYDKYYNDMTDVRYGIVKAANILRDEFGVE